jgi:hypothetical protein
MVWFVILEKEPKMTGPEAIIIIQNRWMKKMKKMGALTPQDAIPAERIRGSGSWMFRRMSRQGVFVTTPDGKIYLDDQAAGRFKTRQRYQILMGIVIALCLVGILLVLLP